MTPATCVDNVITFHKSVWWAQCLEEKMTTEAQCIETVKNLKDDDHAGVKWGITCSSRGYT